MATFTPARESDLELLPAIERRTLVQFQELDLGFTVPSEVRTVAELRAGLEAGLLWVARNEAGLPIGFCLCDRLDGRFHIEEVDLLPEHSRQGIGAALIASACAEARARGFRAVTLCTYRDVPWNAPYYRRLGFRDLEPAEIGPDLRARIESEARGGLDPALRVAMVRPL